MPVVSIIVPVHNVDEYIGECIESIQNQTFKDFELILVDDGSTDHSGDICNEYSKSDDRLKVLHVPYAGVSMARNLGLNQAIGKYIAFVDSDDVVHPQMLEILYDALRRNDADVSYGKYLSFQGEAPKSDLLKVHCEGVYNQKEFWHEWEKAEGAECIVVWNKLYRREIFRDVRFVRDRIHEDVFIFHEWVAKTKKIVKVSNVTYYYRQRKGSIMHTEFTIRNLDVIEALANRVEYFEKIKERRMAELMMIDAMGRMSKHMDCRNKNSDAKNRFKELYSICRDRNAYIRKLGASQKFRILSSVFDINIYLYKVVYGLL